VDGKGEERTRPSTGSLLLLNSGMINGYIIGIAAVKAMVDAVCESDGIVGCKGEYVLSSTCSGKLISILGGFWLGSVRSELKGIRIKEIHEIDYGKYFD